MAQGTQFRKPVLSRVDVICDWNRECLHTGKAQSAIYGRLCTHTCGLGLRANHSGTLVPGSSSHFFSSQTSNRSLGSTEHAPESLGVGFRASLSMLTLTHYDIPISQWTRAQNLGPLNSILGGSRPLGNTPRYQYGWQEECQ